MNEFLRFESSGCKDNLKNNVIKNVTSTRKKWGWWVILDKKKIEQVGNFPYLGSINNKDGGWSEYVKNTAPGVKHLSKIHRGVFSQIKKFRRIWRWVCESRLEYWKQQWWQYQVWLRNVGISEYTGGIVRFSSEQLSMSSFRYPFDLRYIKQKVLQTVMQIARDRTFWRDVRKWSEKSS